MLKSLRLKVIQAAISQAPAIIVTPAIIFVILLAAGLAGVLVGCKQEADDSRDRASTLAAVTANTIALAFQTFAIPVFEMAVLAERIKDYPTVLSVWGTTLPLLSNLSASQSWVSSADTAATLILAPQGRRTAVWPPSNLAGIRLVDDLSDPSLRPGALASIQTRMPTVIGPVPYMSADGSITDESFILRIPIFIRNATVNETFGMPWGPTDCPVGLCWDPVTRTKFWGFVSMDVRAREFLQALGDPLGQLEGDGYKVRITRPGAQSPLTTEPPVVLVYDTSHPLVQESSTPPDSLPSDAISTALPLTGTPWTLTIWRDTWDPSFKSGLIAVVVLVSLIFPATVFLLLLSWYEHRTLLTTLLPQKALARMRQELTYMRIGRVHRKEKMQMLEQGSPAEHMLSILSAILDGETPDMSQVLCVRKALETSADVYRPLADDLSARLGHAAHMDDEVKRALMRQLLGHHGESSASLDGAGGTGACVKQYIPPPVPEQEEEEEEEEEEQEEGGDDTARSWQSPHMSALYQPSQPSHSATEVQHDQKGWQGTATAPETATGPAAPHSPPAVPSTTKATWLAPPSPSQAVLDLSAHDHVPQSSDAIVQAPTSVDGPAGGTTARNLAAARGSQAEASGTGLSNMLFEEGINPSLIDAISTFSALSRAGTTVNPTGPPATTATAGGVGTAALSASGPFQGAAATGAGTAAAHVGPPITPVTPTQPSASTPSAPLTVTGAASLPAPRTQSVMLIPASLQPAGASSNGAAPARPSSIGPASDQGQTSSAVVLPKVAVHAPSPLQQQGSRSRLPPRGSASGAGGGVYAHAHSGTLTPCVSTRKPSSGLSQVALPGPDQHPVMLAVPSYCALRPPSFEVSVAGGQRNRSQGGRVSVDYQNLPQQQQQPSTGESSVAFLMSGRPGTQGRGRAQRESAQPKRFSLDRIPRPNFVRKLGNFSRGKEAPAGGSTSNNMMLMPGQHSERLAKVTTIMEEPSSSASKESVLAPLTQDQGKDLIIVMDTLADDSSSMAGADGRRPLGTSANGTDSAFIQGVGLSVAQSRATNGVGPGGGSIGGFAVVLAESRSYGGSKEVGYSRSKTEGVERVLSTALEKVLYQADEWQFDAYALESEAGGRPLSVLGFWLMHQSGVIGALNLDKAKLARWLCRVEDGYQPNPYHCARHAADVLQTLHVLLHRGGLVPGYTDKPTLLACYVAAMVHDYEHRGRTNDYLVNAGDELALRYNDRAPMENHHLSASFALLRRPELNFLSHLDKRQYDALRKLVIELVLSTDMKQHFTVLSQFSTLHRLSDHESTPGAASTPKPGSSSPRNNHSGGRSSLDVGPTSSLVPLSEAERSVSLQMALKVADVGHLAAPLAVHLRWVSALEEEFFIQGDAERERGLPISPLCDRTKQGITRSQPGFFDFVALPLFKSFTYRFVLAKPLLRAALANYEYWKSVAADPPPSTVMSLAPAAAGSTATASSAAPPAPAGVQPTGAQ